MGFKYELSVQAGWDVDEIVAWYERQQQGLGAQFLDELDHRLTAVCHHPEMCEVVSGSVRHAILHRFPYHVYYEAEGDVVRVFCVCHEARHPQTWRERLP
jgi:plasmid stabilization system protein ParE